MEEVISPAKGNKRSISRKLTAAIVCGVFGISFFQITNTLNYYKESIQKKTTFKILENYKVNLNEIKLNQIASTQPQNNLVKIIKVKGIQKQKNEAILAKTNTSINEFQTIKVSAIKKEVNLELEREVYKTLQANFIKVVKKGVDVNESNPLEKIANSEKNKLNDVLSQIENKTKYDHELDAPYIPLTIKEVGIGGRNKQLVYDNVNELSALISYYEYSKDEKATENNTVNTDVVSAIKKEATVFESKQIKDIQVGEKINQNIKANGVKDIHEYAAIKTIQKKIGQPINTIDQINTNPEQKLQNKTTIIDFQKELIKTKEIDQKNGYVNTPENIIKETDRIPALEFKKYKLEMDPMEILANEQSNQPVLGYPNESGQPKQIMNTHGLDIQKRDSQPILDSQNNQNSPHVLQGINQNSFRNAFPNTEAPKAIGLSIKDYVMQQDEPKVEVKRVQGNIGPKPDANEAKSKDNKLTDSVETDGSNLKEEKPLTIAELIEKFKNEKTKAEETPANKLTVSNKYYGKVNEAFTGGKKVVDGAKVQILGTDVVSVTNENGEFEFSEKIQINGVLPVLISKENHLNRRVDLKLGVYTEIELISNNSAALTAVVLNDSINESTGFLFAELSSPSNESLENKRIEISGIQYPEVIYINEKGLPDKSLKSTSSRGQFLALNIKPGNYLVNTIDANGVERAPHILHMNANEGVIKKFSLGSPITVKGQILNALRESAKIDSAQIQILGSSKTTTTDKNGQFIIQNIYLDCSENNYVQMDKSGFYRNRFNISCTNTTQNFYAFPAAHIDSISTETGSRLSATSAILLGHVSYNQSVKAQLWGPDELYANAAARGEDYYYDRDGVINASKNRTSSNGNFVIMNAPSGMSYVQTIDKKGKTLSFWPVFLSESTVSVYIQ